MQISDAFHEAVMWYQPTTVEQAAFLIWLAKREKGADKTTQVAESELDKNGLPNPQSYFTMRITVTSEADAALKQVLLTGMVIYASLQFAVTPKDEKDYLFILDVCFIEAEHENKNGFPYTVEPSELGLLN